jgi:hypothetical protein
MFPYRGAGLAFAICAAWPITLAILWVTTGERVHTIDVRWVSGMTGEQRSRAERELSLVWCEPKEPGTMRYFLIDESKHSLEQIVAHPLVEDTHYINRGTFTLENAPHARMWAGDRFTSPWPSALLYVSLIGCLISGGVIGLRDVANRLRD